MRLKHKDCCEALKGFSNILIKVNNCCGSESNGITTSNRDKVGDMDCQYWWRKRTGELEPRPHADRHGYGLRASLGNRQTMRRGWCRIIRGFSRINRGTKIWTDKQKQKAKSVLWKVRSVCWESGLSSGNCSKPELCELKRCEHRYTSLKQCWTIPDGGFKCMCVSQQSSDDPTEHDVLHVDRNVFIFLNRDSERLQV